MAKYKLLFKESYYDIMTEDTSEYDAETREIREKPYSMEELHHIFLLDAEAAKQIAKDLCFNVEIGIYDCSVGYICFRSHRFVFSGSNNASSSFLSLLSHTDKYTFRVSQAYKDPISEIRLWYRLGEQ